MFIFNQLLLQKLHSALSGRSIVLDPCDYIEVQEDASDGETAGNANTVRICRVCLDPDSGDILVNPVMPDGMPGIRSSEAIPFSGLPVSARNAVYDAVISYSEVNSCRHERFRYIKEAALRPDGLNFGDGGSMAYIEDGKLFLNSRPVTVEAVFSDLGIPTAVCRSADGRTDCVDVGTLSSTAMKAVFEDVISAGMLVFPKGVTAVEDGLFMDCSSLVSVTVPEGVTRLGRQTFCNCDSLKEVRLPSTLKEIAAGCFRDCTALEEIAVPDGVELVGTDAFVGCESLRKVTLPAGTDVAEYAFFGCVKLKEVRRRVTETGHAVVRRAACAGR